MDPCQTLCSVEQDHSLMTGSVDRRDQRPVCRYTLTTLTLTVSQVSAGGFTALVPDHWYLTQTKNVLQAMNRTFW